MKTNLFNFKRVGLLFQRYFTERFRTELIYWGIMAIVFMFLRNNFPAMFALILIAGVFYASRFFKEIHHSGNGVAYFMIPATQLEKLTVAIVMTTLYYFAMMMIVYVIGNLAGTFLNNMLADMDFLRSGSNMTFFNHSSLRWIIFEEVLKLQNVFSVFGVEYIQWIVLIFIAFLIHQSLFLFGSIYFKKNQAFKTFAVIILFYLLLGILMEIEVKLILGDFKSLAGIDLELWNRMVVTTVKIFYSLLSPFCWLVSYFRLTEKQI